MGGLLEVPTSCFLLRACSFVSPRSLLLCGCVVGGKYVLPQESDEFDDKSIISGCLVMMLLLIVIFGLKLGFECNWGYLMWFDWDLDPFYRRSQRFMVINVYRMEK